MTTGSLVQGLLALLVLLMIVGLLGGIGPVELLLWLVLVGAWVVWWMASRRRRNTTV